MVSGEGGGGRGRGKEEEEGRQKRGRLPRPVFVPVRLIFQGGREREGGRESGQGDGAAHRAILPSPSPPNRAAHPPTPCIIGWPQDR